MEARLERRPALVREDGELGRAALFFVPVQKRELELRELRQEIGVRALGAKLLLHVLRDRVDLGFPRRHLVEVLEEVELGVFLDVHAEVEERLDRRVAREEVVGTGTKAEHLEVLDAEDDASDRREVLEFLDGTLRVDDRVLGNIDLETPKTDVVTEIEDAAQGVAAV